MKTQVCGIIASAPLCFPWGFDEEDEGCVALKLILLHKITALRADGVKDFAVAMDDGIGLYASEIINALRESDPEMTLRCVVPYEGQATKWPPNLRERYFAELGKCSELAMVSTVETPDCRITALLNVIDASDVVLAVTSPEDVLTTVALHYGKRLAKQLAVIEPGTMNQ